MKQTEFRKWMNERYEDSITKFHPKADKVLNLCYRGADIGDIKALYEKCKDMTEQEMVVEVNKFIDEVRTTYERSTDKAQVENPENTENTTAEQ